MANAALDEKDNQSCGNCYLYSDKLGVCLLKGEEVAFDDTCKKWLTLDTCKGCLIDFKNEDKNNL